MFGFKKGDKVRDPVCGMKIDKNKISYTDKKGTYYFCSQNCKDTFVAVLKKG